MRNDSLPSRLIEIRALLETGKVQRAVEIARDTAVLYPGIAAVAVALGEALLAGDHLPAAIAEFQRALRLDPDLDEARYGVGRAWLEAGEPQKALEIFAPLNVERFAGLPSLVARAEAMKAERRSNANYVRHLFDQFAADYDARMIGQLGYGAPRILRELADLVIQPPRRLAILDLGCGTGLSGLAFRDLAARLDGVDLSPRMIEMARARGIYDALQEDDAETALARGPQSYDLVVAADTLVYFGDLSKVFAGVSQALKPGGFFLFTTEKMDGEGFELGPRRRWRHSQSYLRDQAADAGMEISGFLEASPRTEAGIPVPGFAVALSKPGGPAN